MARIRTLKIRSKGTVTIPAELRRKYGLDKGDILTLIDLGDGSFLLIPIVTKGDRLGDRVAKAMAEARVSEDELLAVLDEERERFYRERYVQS